MKVFQPTDGGGGGGGTIGGTIAATQVAYGSALDTIIGDGDFTRSLVDGQTRIATFGSNQVFQIDSQQFHFGNGINFADLQLQYIPGQINSLYLGQDAGNLGAETGGTGRNTGIGYQSARLITTGSDNTFLGAQAGAANATSSRNVYLGSSAGDGAESSDNVLIGWRTGRLLTAGSNIFIGTNAGKQNTNGGANIAIGVNSLTTQGAGVGGNTVVGDGAGAFNISGNHLAFFGQSAGSGNTTGADNTFVGQSAGNTNSVGYSGTFIGSSAGFSNTGAINNTYVGAFAGINNNDNDNVAVGVHAGEGAVGTSSYDRCVIVGNFAGQALNAMGANVLVGFNAGNGLTGGNAVMVGYEAGAAASSAFSNVFIGYQSGILTNSGANNMFLGALSGRDNTTGGFNVFIGDSSGGVSETGNGLIMIGSGSGVDNDGWDDSIALGRDAIVTASNQMMIGSSGHTISEVVVGSGAESATPGLVFFKASDSTAILNNPGSSLVFQSGRSTGTAASPNIYFQVSKPGGSGTTLNTYSTVIEISGTTGGVSLNGEYTFPLVDGAAGEVMTTDGAGNLSFTAAATGTVTGTGNANQVTYWSGATSITGSNDFSWDPVTKVFTVGDVASTGNDTEFTVDDQTQEIRNATDGQFNVTNSNGSNYYLAFDTATKIFKLGDIDSVGNGTYIIINDVSSTVQISNVPTYANDAAAILGGLSTGELYKTTTLGITSLNIVP